MQVLRLPFGAVPQCSMAAGIGTETDLRQFDQVDSVCFTKKIPTFEK
jgi:hypothetical protein